MEPLDLSTCKLDLSISGAFAALMHEMGPDGQTRVQRDARQRELVRSTVERKADALNERELASMPVHCTHEPECAGVLCKQTLVNRRKAQEEYDKAIAIIEAETAPKRQPRQMELPQSTARAAVSALARPASTQPVADPIKQNPAARNLLAVPRNRAPKPINPSAMRHTAATAASRTTVGRQQGRSVSASLQPRVNPTKTARKPSEHRDTSLEPKEYYSRWGSPPPGSRMWLSCWELGLLKASRPQHTIMPEHEQIDHDIRRDALEDFQLVLE